MADVLLGHGGVTLMERWSLLYTHKIKDQLSEGQCQYPLLRINQFDHVKSSICP